ncbi:Mitochondrial pyruvate carrier 1 isoform D [Glycine soja]|nr:Mitochondrial pyruvate carrier 1 isoform D [Glycine soja]
MSYIGCLDSAAGCKIQKIVHIKMNILRSFWNSPTGLKTTHFWGPAFNWSLPFAAAMDTKKPPETISVNMTGGHKIQKIVHIKMNILRSFWNSPTGLKTTHFWGPAFNWSLPFAAAMDTKKPPETISVNMTGVMCVYSALCMRFAWMVRPRNPHLLVCHVSNETVQLYQLSRWFRAQRGLEQNKKDADADAE